VAVSDPRRAVELYQKASDLGSSQAMLILCDLYDTGRYVRKDKDRAANYLKEAAALGNKVALETFQNRR
jgi:TPR repeat protein